MPRRTPCIAAHAVFPISGGPVNTANRWRSTTSSARAYASVGTNTRANPAAASVEANVDVTSVDTGQPQRDGHLRNDDFFSADQYPQATFRSTRVELDNSWA